jgi:glycerophosphoryl diester phosphodiesterase
MHWPFPRWIAHRGGGRLAPENTLAGFALAHALGYRAAECDAVLSADGMALLLHDRELERTTDGHGQVDAQSWASLAHLDAGAWFADRYRGERLPALSAVLDWCAGHGVWLNLEIKPVPGAERLTGQVVARMVAQWLQAHGAGDPGEHVLLSSFSEAALQAARAEAPQLPRGLLFEGLPADWAQRAQALDVVSIHLDQAVLRPAQVQAIAESGRGVLAYTVNDPVRAAELLAWGVGGICTDRPDRLGPGAGPGG